MKKEITKLTCDQEYYQSRSDGYVYRLLDKLVEYYQDLYPDSKIINRHMVNYELIRKHIDELIELEQQNQSFNGEK